MGRKRFGIQKNLESAELAQRIRQVTVRNEGIFGNDRKDGESRGILASSGSMLVKSLDPVKNLSNRSEINLKNRENYEPYSDSREKYRDFETSPVNPIGKTSSLDLNDPKFKENQRNASEERKNFIWHQDFQNKNSISSLKYPNPSDDKLYSIEEEKEIHRNNSTQPGRYMQNYPDANGEGVSKHLEEQVPEFIDELDKLQEELKKKNEEIARYRELLVSKNVIKDNSKIEEVYNMISKVQQDKQRLLGQRKQNSMSLDFQISQKQVEKQLEFEKREKEQIQRLEMLKAMRESDVSDRKERYMRAQAYREELDVQAKVRNLITHRLPQSKSIFAQSDASKSSLHQFHPPNPFAKTTPEASFLPVPTAFTKKAPKTLCYNPITGDIKDTSPYIRGTHPVLASYSSLNNSTDKSGKDLVENGDGHRRNNYQIIENVNGQIE